MPGNYHFFFYLHILHLKTHVKINKKENSFFHNSLTLHLPDSTRHMTSYSDSHYNLLPSQNFDF